jgi:serine/threonine protein kinase
MAPEVFRHELYNHKVDQYAFAMICYQLFQGLPPFYSLDPVQAARAAAQHNARPEWGGLNRLVYCTAVLCNILFLRSSLCI